jgi:DNA-binding transcriptional MerR regulator
MRTVSEVAALTGVTVRTLHHYDEIGLLSPRERSEAGYRLYRYEDLERLREILVWRELGFTLGDIAALLDDPGHDQLSALRRQRALVHADLGRLGAVASLLDEAIAARERGTRQTEEEMFDPAAHQAEARERWGQTDAYKESARRTATYGDAEWTAIKAESESLVGEYAALMARGVAAGDAGARAVAERHRAHIARWFYECSPEMHRRLGEMYVTDERFRRNYDNVAPGLALYVRDAINAAAVDVVDSENPAA